MQVKRIAGALGAEIKGVDLGQILTPEISIVIRDLLNEHEVLFFRQQAIEPAQQRDLAAIFGPLQTHPAYGTVEGIPEVMILESTADKPSKIEVWHSDMTFRQHPPSVTVLRGMVIPNVGGDTLFASQYDAYDQLSDSLRAVLDGLCAVNAAGKKRVASTRSERLKDSGSGVDPDALVGIHPVVRTHPETGRKALFVNAAHTVAFDGWSEEESRGLLDYLFTHQISPEFQCRLRWQVGDVAFWDNRCVQHYPLNDYHGYRRLLHRITLKGDVPV
mgnify:CR=1 FL=1